MSHKPGKGFTGFHHTDESKAALSKAHIGKTFKMSEEAKEKMKAAAIRRWQDPEFRAKHTKYTAAERATWNSWDNMISRCTRPSSPNYKYYGGRGIKICAEWMFFENFLADMGVRPDGHTLDRIDNNGNYEPGNCRWATKKEQFDNSDLTNDSKTGRWIRKGGT